MSGIGIDPGSTIFSVACCEAEGPLETLSRGGLLDKRATLPAAVMTTDIRAPSLEFQEPLTPHGVGGLWPPEAQADASAGARRVPLALALAALEAPTTNDRTSEAASVSALRWSWPSFTQVHDPPVKSELVTTLLRRTLQAYAEECHAPVALAVPNALPLMTQSALVSRAQFDARLIWRCMAAALGHLEMAQPSTRRREVGTLIADGTPALHVHLGFDGFEATAFTFRKAKGKQGPELLIPARPRLTTSNSASRPFLGVQIASFALRRLGGLNSEQLWEGMFGGSIASQLVHAEGQSIRHPFTVPDSPTEDVRVGWKSAIGGASLSAELLRAAVQGFVRRVEEIIDAQAEGGPRIAILTGDFSRPDWIGAFSSSAFTISQTLLAELLTRKSIMASVSDHGVVARGAALFASRRARSWATYLDQLPSVKIVAQTPAGPSWQTVLESKYHDAGVPVTHELKDFSLNAGAKHMKLPVYVDEFGPDTKDVLESRIDFEKATLQRSEATVSIQIEAATGMPVVRATIHGEVDQSAEVDWSRDREDLQTGKSMAEYLEGLPRAYPPIEEMAAGDWWLKGGKFKLGTVGGVRYTAEALCEQLVQFAGGVEAKNAPRVKELTRLARKREYHAGSKKWIAATGVDGTNPDSKSLRRAVTTLMETARTWTKGGIPAENAAKALAALRCREIKWVEFVMGFCDNIKEFPEHHFMITSLGNCVADNPQMGTAVEALARRLGSKVQVAKEKGAAPVGISTLRALGAQFALHPEALARIDVTTAEQLANDVTLFIEQMLEFGGGFVAKFQAALRTLVFLTRRRAYQDNFLPAGGDAFNRAVECCAQVYVGAKLSLEARALAAGERERKIARFKEDLKQLRAPGQVDGGAAHEETCRVIDAFDINAVNFDSVKFPKAPDKLLRLLVQVVQYIEGRGTGILVIEDEEDDSDGE